MRSSLTFERMATRPGRCAVSHAWRGAALVSSTLLLSSAAPAREDCGALAKRIDATVIGLHPPLEGRSAKDRPIPRYSAPAAHCRLKRQVVQANLYLTIYTPYNGWLQVGFVDNAGEDHIVWVKKADVRIGPPLGPK